MNNWKELWENLPEATGPPPDDLVKADELMEREKELKIELETIRNKIFDSTVRCVNLIRQDWSQEEMEKAISE